jgi:hypothetical protein
MWSARAAESADPALAAPRGCGVSSARFAEPSAPRGIEKFSVVVEPLDDVVIDGFDVDETLVTVPIAMVVYGPAGPG